MHTRLTGALALHLLVASASLAQEAAPTLAKASDGILPIPDYTGDLWTRRALLGDFNGGRTNLANAGVQFGIDFNQTVQSVVDGGRDINTAYGGTIDYNLSLDLMRMGVLPGALIKFRGESRYGETVNADAGPILPVNADFMFPLTAELDEGVPLAITTLLYTQFLSESFGVYFGKLDTFDGDPNEFASGRGLTQFQNLNFIFSPTPLVTVPYSTLAAGLVWLPTKHITLTTSLLTTADSSTTTGFDKIGDGWTWASEAQFQYRLGHLPGGFNIGGSYAWAQHFSTIGRRFVFEPGEGITPSPDADDSWSIYASAWQYIVADDSSESAETPMNLLDGVPDRKGLGLFVRAGFADEDTNPTDFAISGGIGGRGLLPSRDHDLFGVGVFHNEVQTRRLTSIVGLEDSTQGFEAFYNFALTPAAGLTFDVQVVEPATDRIDNAVVIGARLLLRF
ncbi:MAG: carbohydrate porin [Phycisphaerae bacterium]|nr:carbohydrate porin [Phycisphaerae bacterium]